VNITSISAVMVLPHALSPNIPTFMTTTFNICQRAVAPMGELVECCCCEWMDMSTQCFACCIENMKENLMILQNAFLPCRYNAKRRHCGEPSLGCRVMNGKEEGCGLVLSLQQYLTVVAF